MSGASSLWLVRVVADADGGACTAKPAPREAITNGYPSDSLLVSAVDEEHALKIAGVILRARQARALVAEKNGAFREGYAFALAELRTQLEQARRPAPPPDVTPESVEASGKWFGREDMIDHLERWALAVAPTTPKEGT